MEHITRILGTGALAVVMVMTGSPAPAQDPGVSGVFVSADLGTDLIDKAIETAIAKMNFVTRPIARGRLKKTNPRYQRIQISREGAQIAVQFDQRKPVLMPADGRPVKWTREDGEIFDVSAHSQGSQLIQTFKAEDGQRVNQFTLHPDGSLTLDVTVSSPQLPAPVHYVLTYTRQ
ncbi:MAG TPA: hypothetical protein VKB34_17405 [Povalibacter sp.]|nr:hypothetical protein [Povalibacter sp.]